ncbi:Exocyst complex component 6, partial [Trichinella pseudospiralis]
LLQCYDTEMVQPDLKQQSTENSEAGSSLKSSSLGTEHIYALSELETSDVASVDFVLRALYENNNVEFFLKALEKRIRQYDREIEKLCNFHYHDFVKSVEELVTLRQDCQELKNALAASSGYLSDCTRTLASVASEIIRQRKLQRNIVAAVDSVSMCLPVLEKFARLNDLLNEKKYYPALRTLEQLEHTYLPRVARYRFGDAIVSSIKGIRQQIKTASFNEFTDFLENIRNVSGKIGAVALRHTVEHLKQSDVEEKFGSSRYELLAFWKMDNRPESLQAVDTDEIDFSAQDMIDFSPVYRCCHIFSVLGARESFEAYYRKQRREQAVFSLLAPHKVFNSFQLLLNYIFEVIGFFVIEDHIMQTASDLVTRSYRDELWEIAVGHVERTLNDHFGRCTDDEAMLPIKSLILLFAHTMKGYGYHVKALYRVLQNFRDQYYEILMSKSCAHFDHLLRTENYAPLVINSTDELKSLMERFPLAKNVLQGKGGLVVSLENFSPPLQLDFSEFAPGAYEEMKHFVRACLKFVDNLEMSHSEMHETLRNTVDLLLQRFNGHLKMYVIDEVSLLSLTQLVQITINIGYLEKSCEALHQFMLNILGNSACTLDLHILKLKEDVFKDARSEVEQRIDESMRQKVDEIVSVAQYDWELASCNGQPTDYVSDLILFLEATFVSFAALPVQLSRHICVQACKYICNRLVDILVDPAVKQISMGALEQVNLDVMQFEQFVSRCQIAGAQDSTLILTFVDIRQMLDLVMADDWSTYLADFGRQTGKYVRVHPLTATSILEKIYEFERRKSAIFGKVKDKDRKRYLETVLKQLKNCNG